MLTSQARPATARREFLKSAAALAAAGLWTSDARPAFASERKRVLRLAHLTDLHVQPELQAGEGVTACLRHVNQLSDRPDLILSGGDHIMDAFHKGRERTAAQWDLWQSIARNENSIPVRACLGNHDIWGWDLARSGTTGQEPQHGKRWACDVLGLDKPYYSFDQAGWHLIALDSVGPSSHPNAFTAYLDEAQWEWLRRDLEAVPRSTPILIWSHIPIVSAVVNHLSVRESIHEHSLVDAGHVHADSAKLVALFSEFPNVKACLAGHLHRIERIEIKGIRYYCNGAVCGKWWRGANDGYPEGYAVVDLYDDGHHDLRYMTYGWRASALNPG